MLIISDILTMDNITYSEKVRGNFTGKVKWSTAVHVKPLLSCRFFLMNYVVLVWIFIAIDLLMTMAQR